jgi:hypothetical protein
MRLRLPNPLSLRAALALRPAQGLRPPLAFTLLTTATLLLVPALLLLSFPRRTATGLERLMPAAALLQSFAVQPAQPPPPLWVQRLGPASAGRLWAAQRRLWWQFWGAHGDAGAYLVLSAPASLPLPANSLRLDDLVVVAPDPLARQLLQEQLRARRRPPRGLALRCTQHLRQSQAVHWNGGAMGQMLGPLASLAQDLQQGCLVLSSQGRSLLWQGEADGSEGALGAAPASLPVPTVAPLAGDQLLELRGRRLELLLRGLLASPVLRQSLAQTYGLGPVPLRQLQASPFQLRLQAVPKGPFLAGLQLQLTAGSGRPVLERWLKDLSGALEDQGLAATQPLPGITGWSREDGTLLGGWRWLPQGQLLLFLGPVPTRIPAGLPLTESAWRLRLQPAAMATAGLLPSGLPPVVQRSQQLELIGLPLGQHSGERRSSLAGRLELRAAGSASALR